MKSNELAKILNGCIKNNRDSQKAFYNFFYSKLMTISMRYSSSDEHAKKILEEGFLNIFEDINFKNNFDDPINWVKQKFIKHCINHLKKDLEIPITVTAITKLEEIDFENLEIEPKVLIKQLQSLNTLERIVFNLKVFEEFSVEEISKILNISKSDVNLIFENSKASLTEKLKHFSLNFV